MIWNVHLVKLWFRKDELFSGKCSPPPHRPWTCLSLQRRRVATGPELRPTHIQSSDFLGHRSSVAVYSTFHYEALLMTSNKEAERWPSLLSHSCRRPTNVSVSLKLFTWFRLEAVVHRVQHVDDYGHRCSLEETQNFLRTILTCSWAAGKGIGSGLESG